MTAHFDIRTAPFSRWNVENALDEPAHGYFARLVAAEGHSSVARYADGIDVDTRYTDPEILLAVLLKLPLVEERKALLRNVTPRRESDGIWLAGQRFNITDFSFSSRRWCRGCLQESPHHRAWWDITTITECPYHGERLHDQDEQGNPIRWWWPVMNASPSGVLLSKPMPRVDDSQTLAAYIIGRLGFDRAIAAPLLDQSDLGTVIDVCQLLGTLLSSPWSDALPAEERNATELGFQAVRGGAVGLVEALRDWMRSNVPSDIVGRGYTIVFGQANKRREVLDDRNLSAILKKVFRKALALEARSTSARLRTDEFLGDEIGLTTLAQRIGVNRRGLAAVADALGFLPERKWYRAPVKFDPTEAAAIEFHCRQMVTRVEVATALGMSSQDVQPLVEAGFLRQFPNVTANGPSGLRFLQSDLKKVLAALMPLAQENCEAPSVAFFTYAKNNRIRMGRLAVSILQGRHQIAPGASGKPGFRGVRVVSEPNRNLPSTSRAATRLIARPAEFLSLIESEMELNIHRETLMRLIEEGYLARVDEKGACRWLNKTSVLEFAARHRNAREFLPHFGGSLDALVDMMADNGVDPILARRPKREGQSVNVIYRYADLARVFKLKHDPTRFDEPEFDAFWAKVREMTSNVPPYLQFPSQLPVSGQVVSNGKRKIAFFVTFSRIACALTLEGKRQASEFEQIVLPIADERWSLARLEEVLLALADMTSGND